MEYPWILLLILIYATDKAVGKIDPCTTYQSISDITLQTSSACFPQSPVPAWYRYTGNLAGTMATKCPNVSDCGGSEHVWIEGLLPMYSDGTTVVTLCLTKGSVCCKLVNRLGVKNCKSFFVFELRRLPNCNIRYCFNKTDVALVPVSTTLTTSSTKQKTTPTTLSTISKTTRSFKTSFVTTPIAITNISKSTTRPTVANPKLNISSEFSNDTRNKEPDPNGVTTVIAVCASIGALIIIGGCIIFAVVFRVYRSKRRHNLKPKDNQNHPNREEQSRNVKFNAANLQCRNNSDKYIPEDSD